MTFCNWSPANRNQAHVSCWYQYFETLSKYFCKWLQKSFYTSKNVYIGLSSRSCERGTICAAGLFYQLNKCWAMAGKLFQCLNAFYTSRPGTWCLDRAGMLGYRQNTIVFLNVAGFNCPILCMLFPGMNCLFKTTAETVVPERNMWGFYKISGWTSHFGLHDWKSELWAFTPTSPTVLEDDLAICCYV